MLRKVNFKHSDEQLKKEIKPILAYDIAQSYHELDEMEKKRLLHVIGLDKLTDMFVELDVDDQLDVLSHLEEVRKKSLFRNMESDDLKEFIEDIDEELRPDMFALFSKVKAKTESKQP